MAFSPDDRFAYALHTIYPTAVDIYDLSTFARVGQFSIVDRSKVMTMDQSGQHLFDSHHLGSKVMTMDQSGQHLFVAFDGVYYGHTEVRVYDTGLATASNQPPVARCHDVTMPADSNCQATATATDVDNGSYDPDGDAFTLALTPAGPYPLGTNRVTLTVTDSHGVSDSCTALVIVQDSTPPQITCPADITVDSTSPGGAAVSFAPTASDTCSGPPTVVCAPSSGSGFPIGTTSIACTATDHAGNTVSCQFQVTVLGPRDMLVRLIALVRAQALRPQPLLATLDAALASIDRDNTTSAVNQLHAFQNKVRAQVAPSDQALGGTLVQAAQNIITALAGGFSESLARQHGNDLL